jgi:hypothetical protein
MENLKAQWPINPEHYRAKADSFCPLLRQVGIYRFARAVELCIDAAKLSGFPRPGELRAYVPELTDQEKLTRRAQQRMLLELSQYQRFIYECQQLSQRTDPAGQKLYNSRLEDFQQWLTVHLGYDPANPPQYTADTERQLRENFLAIVADKNAHPESYFGQRDVKAMMRLKQRDPNITFNQIMDQIAQLRQNRHET